MESLTPPRFEAISEIPFFLMASKKIAASLLLFAAFSKPGKINILLADDDPDDRLMFKDVIDELDLKTELKMVADGEQLIKHIEAKKEYVPDIIFLDINMPCMNGMKCLDELRKREELKNIPIIMFTTSNNSKDIETAYEKGATLFLTKPSSFNELMKKAKKILELDWDLYPQQNGLKNFVVN